MKKRFPDMLKVIGEDHPSLFTENNHKGDVVDFVIRSEGKDSLHSLCKIIEAAEYSVTEVAGLSDRND